MFKSSVSASALLCLLAASPASAAVIDFGAASWGAAEGMSSYSTTVAGVGLTVSVAPAAEGATIEHTSAGLGVDFNDRGASAQQIEGVEVLTLQFNALVDVTQLTVSNLYDWGIIQIEVGTYTLNGQTTAFQATNLAGTLTVPVDAAPTTTISFRAQDGWSWFGDNGFTLRSVTFDVAGGAVAASAPELDPNLASSAIATMVGSTLLVSERRRRAA
jgi:hypothetical protein